MGKVNGVSSVDETRERLDTLEEMLNSTSVSNNPCMTYRDFREQPSPQRNRRNSEGISVYRSVDTRVQKESALRFHKTAQGAI